MDEYMIPTVSNERVNINLFKQFLPENTIQYKNLNFSQKMNIKENKIEFQIPTASYTQLNEIKIIKTNPTFAQLTTDVTDDCVPHCSFLNTISQIQLYINGRPLEAIDEPAQLHMGSLMRDFENRQNQRISAECSYDWRNYNNSLQNGNNQAYFTAQNVSDMWNEYDESHVKFIRLCELYPILKTNQPTYIETMKVVIRFKNLPAAVTSVAAGANIVSDRANFYAITNGDSITSTVPGTIYNSFYDSFEISGKSFIMKSELPFTSSIGKQFYTIDSSSNCTKTSKFQFVASKITDAIVYYFRPIHNTPCCPGNIISTLKYNICGKTFLTSFSNMKERLNVYIRNMFNNIESDYSDTYKLDITDLNSVKCCVPVIWDEFVRKNRIKTANSSITIEHLNNTWFARNIKPTLIYSSMREFSVNSEELEPKLI